MEIRSEFKERLRRYRDWNLAIDDLEQELMQVDDAEQQSELLFDLARLTEEVVPERDRALALYQRAWKIHPANIKALERAREVYHEIGRLEMVAKVGELQLKNAGDAHTAANLAAMVGEAHLDCGNRDRALPLLKSALEAQPDSVRLRDAIAAAEYDSEFWSDTVERLAADAEKADSDTAARMLLRAARIQRMESTDDAAYESLLRKVLENDAQNESANFSFEQLLAQQERWEELEEHHQRRAYAAPSDADRARLYNKFALEWVQRFKDRDRAAKFFSLASEAVAQNGAPPPAAQVAAFHVVREIFGGRSEWDRVLGVADAVLARLDEDRRLYMAMQAGLIAWHELNDVERARVYFEIVRQLDPEAPELADFDATAPAVPPAPVEAAAEPEPEPEDTGKKKRKRKKRKTKGASEEVEAAPAPEPEPEPEPEPVQMEAEEPEPEPVQMEAEEPEPAPKPAPMPVFVDEPDEPEDLGADVQSAMNEAREVESGGGAPDKVIDAWRKAIAVDHTVRSPRRELARVLRGYERWNALVEALKDEETRAAQTPAQKVRVLRELVQVYRDQLRLDVMVVNTLNQILQINPSDGEVLDTLAAQYESMKRWPDLVSTLNKKAPLVEDHAERVALHLRIANLYIDKFSNQAEAIKAFEAVLELDQDNEEAIRHLEEVYEKRRDWEKLINLRERDIERTTDDAERAAKTLEVAQLAKTRLKKPAVCIKWWEKVREFEPAHEEALEELEKYYQREKNWDGVATICSVRAEHAGDLKARTDALQTLGLLYQDKLDDPKSAIDAWQRLLEVDPNHRRAQDALKKLYIADQAWDELESFYRQADKMGEYVRVLERQLETTDGEDALRLAMKVAVLYRDEIQKADRAMRAFEKVLSLDENNLEAAEALIPLYEKGRDPRKLIRALEIQLDQTSDPDTRIERLQYLAQHSEEKIRDKGAAYGYWLRAHAERPDAAWIREHVERLAQETGAWTELVEAYQASYGKLDDREALPLMLQVARAQEQELGEINAALETNRKIVEIDDGNEAALAALERLHLGTHDFESLLDIYRKKLEITLDGDAQTQIQYKIGQLYEEEVRDDDKAIDAYQAILEANGDQPRALAALDRIYARNERWADLADVISREIVQTGPDDDLSTHVQLKFRLGQIKEVHLDDVAFAEEQYREILDLDRSHDGARHALERKLDEASGEAQLTAAGILEPIFGEVEDWPRLIQVHEIQLAAEDDVGPRVGLLMRIGELQAKKLGDAAQAFNAYARAFREDPAHEGAKNELEELCGLLDDGWPRMVELFVGALDKADELSPALVHELSLKVAAAFVERLDDMEKAIEYYRMALGVEPDDATAIEALDRIFTAHERYPDLLEIYRKKVDISQNPDERLSILFRIAAIHEEMLQNKHDAISTYNDILAQDDENVRALRALDRLYGETEQWNELADNLSRQLALCEHDMERVDLLVRLAQLRESQLEEVAAAVETYRQVIEIQPDNAGAITALERLIGYEDHELAIAQILEPIYKASAAWERQIGVYEIMAKHAYDPERKIELLHAIAELYEIGGDDGSSAFRTYSRALREEPRHESTQAQLDRLSRMLGGWHDLVQLYDEIAEGVSDEELKVQLLTKVAQIYELELGEDHRAVQTYKRILEVVPGQVEAAAAIQAVHERNADYPALVGALKQKAELVVDLPERKSLLFKAAQIQEEVLEQADEAIATYNAVLDLDDIDLQALTALERLYIRLERWEPLKDVYAKKADLADTPDEKKQMLYVLGQVHDRELGDVAKAIETYQGILDIDPDELPAIQALDRLFGQAERWYDLLQNLERQVELAETSGESVGLKYRIGDLWQRELNDLARAIEAYREALDIDPNHYETLAALNTLLHSDEGEPVLAALVLEPIYEAQAEFEKLAGVLEVMIKHSEDPIQRVELLHRVASLYEYRLERYQDAFGAFGRALKEDNGNEQTLGHLERLADATRMWHDLAQLYAGEAEKSLDAMRQVDLLSRLARVYVEELGLIEEAIATYKKILDVEFDNRAAVLALDRLYSHTERWQELSEILRKEIQLEDDDEQIVATQFRLGQVLEQALRDLPAAIEVYREILATDPSHVATIGALEMMFLEGQHELEIGSILEPLYQNAGEWEKLHKIHEVQLSKLTELSDRMSMYQRLAELSEQNLYDQPRAFAWWGLSLTEDPQSELAVEEAERLARETAAWHDLVAVYTKVLELHTEPDIQRATLLRLGRVYEKELSEPTSAGETFLRVLSIDDKDPDALEALDRLYEAAGMYDELVEILRRRIEVTLDGDLIIELQFRRGHIYSEVLGDLDAALNCYEEILEQETRNRRALECEEAIFFRREEWQRLYSVYEKLIDVAEGDTELSEIYARMARLSSDALDDEEGAIDMWGRVLDILGDNERALSAIGELYARKEMWEELVDCIERAVAVTEDGHQQIVLYKRLGRVWENRLGRERNALDAWLKAYEINPQDIETLRTLAHLYRATQSWEELSQTIRQLLELADYTDQIDEREIIELNAQLGELEGDVLGRVQDAVDAWRRVMALDPHDFRALNALEQLFTREGRWEECIDVLERRASVQEDPQAAIDTLLQAGAIWEEKVEDHTQAAEVYERVRGADPSNAIASAQLESIYRAQYNWEKLNEILLERVEHTEDTNSRIETFQAVAKIYEEEIGDQESAFVVLQAGFREDYAHEGVAKELERLATAAGKWEDLLAEYTHMVQGMEGENPDAACDLWVKIGRWYGDHLSHVDYAIHSVQQALRINPQHLGALGALADFQRKRGSWAELTEVLRKHASIEPDADRKVELYLNLAELLESQIMDPVQAMSAYQSALEADATSSDALAALDRLYRRHEMWEQLIDILGRRAELAESQDDSQRMKLEIGRLWDEMIVDSGQAIAAFQDVIETDAANLPALRALERLYEKTGQSEKYLDVLEAQLDASPTDAEQVSLYERMASAWEERFGKLDRASECLEKIVAIDERNFQAFRELSRLYRQEAKWESLVDTYRRHIMSANDPATRVELYSAMGHVYENELVDYDRAIEAFTDVLTFDPDEPNALDALGRLYERIEEWDRAIQVMQQLVQTTADPARQVDLYHRIGRITYSYLGEPEQAEQMFLHALAIDEGHVPTMEDLVRLYSSRGDWLKAAQMMVRAEGYTANVLDKVRLLYDAGRIYLERLDAPTNAMDMFAAVMALDPEHLDAAQPLSELYFDEGRWGELSPVLDMMCRKYDQLGYDNHQLNELYYRTAKCAEELGDYEKAMEFYKAAYDIDSTYLPTLLGRGDLLFKMEDWDGAGKIYQTILVQHRDSQDEANVVRIYNRLGNVRLKLGERKKALNMFEKALEIDPDHFETLNAVIDIQGAQGDWEQVIHAKRALSRTAEVNDQVRLLAEVGGIYREKLSNPQKSIAAYQEALEIKPNDHQLLQRVLDLYTETRQWKLAVEVIVRFAELERDPLRKGKYYQAAGTICRDELKATDEAIEYYNLALDSFFGPDSTIPENALSGYLKAFADIDKILTAKRDWKNQERAYRQMIKRLRPGDKVLPSLWHALGEIYRSRLKQFKSAIAAFEVAQQFDPGNRQRGEILAELYIMAGPEMADKAVAQHMEMLKDDPYKYDSYKALRKIYMDTHQYDKTWCVCSTLAFLNKADPEEMQFYEQYKPRGFVKAKQRMTEDTWRKVYHPDQDMYIGAILSAIQQAAALVRGQPHKDFGLKRKDRRAIETDQLQFSKIFYYVAQVINVPLPEVYLQPEQQGEILLANTMEKGNLIPSFVVRANLLQGRPEREIAFVAARKLAFMRSEHYLKLALPTNTELKTALLSAIMLVQPKFPIPADGRSLVAQYLPVLQKRVTPNIREQLAQVVNRFLQHAGTIDMARWGNAVDLTTQRVGFVICGDLSVAAKMVSMEPTVVGGPQVKEKIKELVLYSVSEEYFAVRNHLGTTIG